MERVEASGGKDALQIQMDWSRAQGMEACWALRTNDVHDMYPMGSRRWTYGLAPFKARRAIGREVVLTKPARVLMQNPQGKRVKSLKLT